MKLNWGTGLAIGLGLFVLFILSFVIRITFNDKYNHELVTENYYEKEVLFQKEIEGAQNANKIKAKIKTRNDEKGILILFPEEIAPQKIKGKVALYRPSSKSLDFEETIELSNNHQMLIEKEKLVGGRWDLSINWFYEGEEYFYKERLSY